MQKRQQGLFIRTNSAQEEDQKTDHKTAEIKKNTLSYVGAGSHTEKPANKGNGKHIRIFIRKRTKKSH